MVTPHSSRKTYCRRRGAAATRATAGAPPPRPAAVARRRVPFFLTVSCSRSRAPDVQGSPRSAGRPGAQPGSDPAGPHQGRSDLPAANTRALKLGLLARRDPRRSHVAVASADAPTLGSPCTRPRSRRRTARCPNRPDPRPEVHRIRGHGSSRARGTTTAYVSKRSSGWSRAGAHDRPPGSYRPDTAAADAEYGRFLRDHCASPPPPSAPRQTLTVRRDAPVVRVMPL